LPQTRATIVLLVAAFVKSTHLPVVPSLSKAEDASMGRIVGGILVLVLAWHEREGQRFEDARRWFAAAYHLDRLL
jgi:hypothetical protein